VKTFEDLRVELQSLHIVNGNQYLLTMTLANQNQKKSVWVGLNADSGAVNGRITDSGGFQCPLDPRALSGIQAGRTFVSYQTLEYKLYGFEPATEIKPGDSISATVTFFSTGGRPATTGLCNLQLEFLVGHDFNPIAGSVKVHNLVTKIEVQ